MNGRVLGLTLAIALPAHEKKTPAMTPDHGRHLMTHLQGTRRCDSSPCKEGRYRHAHMPHVQKRQEVGQLMDRAHNSIKPAILPSQLGSAFLSPITAISSVSLFPNPAPSHQITHPQQQDALLIHCPGPRRRCISHRHQGPRSGYLQRRIRCLCEHRSQRLLRVRRQGEHLGGCRA